MNKITPFLWFDDNAEAAADFYLSVFKSGRKLNELRPDPHGPVLAMDLELEGQQLTFLNGGPNHPLTDAFSLVVRCENQEEIDHYWEKLTDGGSEVACGWLKDKFGLSWQIVPINLSKLLRKPSAMQAMMSMKKLVIADLV
jgi:predicted 3-demethylubiquinone-9 3-methyltransferase (glyoxalase superfamily)